ncbi:unnamed protein product [marine sediment metagenome]|uniref:Uncharacterized protein n=1 Tax=marine sediment metagenome TaxID=412755 RepID=X1CVG0_9ZZZZ
MDQNIGDKVLISQNYLQFFPYEQFRVSQEDIIRQIEQSARTKKTYCS